MRRIEYPKNLRKLKMDYLALFDMDKLQNEWSVLRKNPKFKILRRHFPRRVARILLADYRTLAEYYMIFKKLVTESSKLTSGDKEELGKKLNSIFKYDNGYQSQIAGFFMKHSAELNISVCNYCETAHINSYTVESDADHLHFLKTASKDQISKKLNITKPETLDAIMAYNIVSIDDLQAKGLEMKWWYTPDKLRKIFPKVQAKNHFDIDHALDKGSCPILALSLMNFVPSCQVCNQRLKRQYVLGDRIRRIPKAHMSPSSMTYDFDGKVKFIMKPLLKDDGSTPDPAEAVAQRKFFELDFDIKDNDFVDFIELFHLKERYRYHKMEGLYWIQLKERYPDHHIDLMVSGLGMPEFTKDRIKEDLFREDYDRIRKPCFDKLKRDCLNP